VLAGRLKARTIVQRWLELCRVVVLVVVEVVVAAIVDEAGTSGDHRPYRQRRHTALRRQKGASREDGRALLERKHARLMGICRFTAVRPSSDGHGKSRHGNWCHGSYWCGCQWRRS
jgi:hypothetical protein